MRTLCIVLALVATAAAQANKPQTPPVRINVLNICAPPAADQKQIASALARVPRDPHFASDFEVARGHTTIEDAPSDWVRVRRDMSEGPFSAAQYMYSREHGHSRETVVFFARGTGDITQIAIEDLVTAPVAPASLLKTDTPASRISLERLDKPHIVLARCPNMNQAALEPLFQAASQIMSIYRTQTGAREIVPAEVDRLSLGVGPGYRAPKVKPMGKRR